MTFDPVQVTPGSGPGVAFVPMGDGTKAQAVVPVIGSDPQSDANPAPIKAAELPLPVGAATDAKLDALITAAGTVPTGASTLAAQAFRNSGKNIIQRDQDLWTRGANVAGYTPNYGDSPIPGRMSALVTFTNGGGGIAQSTYVKGRTDGVGFTLSWWMKGTGTSYVAAEMRAQDGAGANEQFVNASLTVGTTWTRFYCSGVCPIHNASLIYVNIYFGSNVAVEMDGVMLNVGDLPLDYSPPAIRHPNASFFQVTVGPSPRSSIYMLGDSLIGGANSFECRTELSRLTNNSFIWNAGVGGETSTQILARWNASYAKAGWVVICAGRNDGFAASTVLANIASMVALIPHGRFIICAIPNGSNEPLGGGTCEYIEDVNSQLKDRYGVRFCDWRSQMIAGSTTHIPRAEFLSDTLHPNAVGFAMMARSIADSMAQLGAPFAPNIPTYKIVEHAPSVSFTRPADTTAYTSGDLVANSTTAGSVVASRLSHSFIQPVKRIRLAKSTVSVTNAVFRVHLFSLQPTSAVGDNAAFASTGSASYIGSVDITMGQAFSDGANGVSDAGSLICKRDATKAGIFVLIEARAAYTPGSEEVFTVTAELQEA